ncbi:MAG: hypothetical protein M3R27_09300 [Bacteroidota bacterium]|nr:hypothetical protein [Bacteroidota bacterium]
MRVLFPLIITICIVFCFPSCRSVYKPNAVNVPLLKEKGEAKFYLSNNNLQVAYAISSNTGLMLNGYYEKHQEDFNNDDYIQNRGILGEAGAGLFKTYENKLTVECYGGAGYGKLKIRERDTDENEVAIQKDFSADAYKLFIQPSAGYAGRIFEIAITPRFSAIKYANVASSNYTIQENNEYYFENMEKPLWLFAEPALTLRGGFKWFKLQVQVGRSFRLNEKKLNNNGSLLNAGVVIDIAKWYND